VQDRARVSLAEQAEQPRNAETAMPIGFILGFLFHFGALSLCLVCGVYIGCMAITHVPLFWHGADLNHMVPLCLTSLVLAFSIAKSIVMRFYLPRAGLQMPLSAAETEHFWTERVFEFRHSMQLSVFAGAAAILWSANDRGLNGWNSVKLLNLTLFFIVDDWFIIDTFTRRLKGWISTAHTLRVVGASMVIVGCVAFTLGAQPLWLYVLVLATSLFALGGVLACQLHRTRRLVWGFARTW
jgi:hypothetical protein